MNKKFVSMIVCSMLLSGGLATTMVSCSDDNKEDITNLKDATADLNKQLAALQSALTANQDAAKQAADAAARALAEAQEAAKKGDTALQEAKNAAAEAELAKKAAATAKAEAIQEVIAQLKPLIDAASKLSSENASAIAALAGRIDGIEKGLSNIDLSDINAQLGGQATAIAANAQAIQALQTQMAALSNLQQELTAHANAISGLDAKVATIEATLGQLKSLEADVKANKASLEEVKSQVTALAAKITEEIGNAVNTLAGVLSQRLTSVTLMPDLYVGGIPTIPFYSAKYDALVYKKDPKDGLMKWLPSGDEFLVSNNSATAQYRLNPGTVAEADIDITDLHYYTRIATARSGEILDDIINVRSASVGDNGILTLKLGKTTTKTLNDPKSPKGNIYTVSLKVPIAQKHLFTEQGEKEAAVYSEFTRLEETYFQPELRFKSGSEYKGNVHMSDSITLYRSNHGEKINKDLVYNESYNLFDLVDACEFIAPDTHKEMTREKANEYGLDIAFAVATAEYTFPAEQEDKTNQQAFVKLSGENYSILTPVASNGVTNNKVIIGKQPIIRAMLYDVNNGKMVDVKYLKVQFTAEETTPKVIEWPTISTVGNACSGASYDFTWKDMAEKVLMEIGSNGMSKEDFTKIYTQWEVNDTHANKPSGKLEVHMLPNNLDASIPVMTWTVDPTLLTPLRPGDNTFTFEKTVTFTDPNGLYPTVTIKVVWKVTITVSAPTLGKTDPLKWQNNTMKVYPVPMKLVNGRFDGTTAYYATNILEGRLKPYVNGLLGCANYDIDFASTHPAQTLTYPSDYGHWLMTAANQDRLLEVIYSIDNNDDGKKLVSGGGIVTLSWKTNFNGLAQNRYQFATTNLQIVKILSINAVLAKEIVDNSVAQTISILNNYSMTDAFGNLVAAVATPANPLAYDYYQFYAVQAPKFGSDIVIADNVEGTQNVRTLKELNMTADIDQTTGVLTFQNNGSPLQADAYIIVPVTVEHKWGKLEDHIAVPLKKSSAPLNVRRK